MNGSRCLFWLIPTTICCCPGVCAAQSTQGSVDVERASISGIWECVYTDQDDLPKNYLSQQYVEERLETRGLDGKLFVQRTDGASEIEETSTCTRTSRNSWSGSTLRMVSSITCGADDTEPSVSETTITPGPNAETLTMTTTLSTGEDVHESTQLCGRISEDRFRTLSEEWAIRDAKKQALFADIATFFNGLGLQTLEYGSIEYKLEKVDPFCGYEAIQLSSVAIVPVTAGNENGLITVEQTVRLSLDSSADPPLFRLLNGGPEGRGKNPGLFVLTNGGVSKNSKVRSVSNAARVIAEEDGESSTYTFYFSRHNTTAPERLRQLLTEAQDLCRQ